MRGSSKFFLVWNICSVLFLWLTFESTVSLLEVLPEENFVMFVLMTVSVICFYKVSFVRLNDCKPNCIL